MLFSLSCRLTLFDITVAIYSNLGLKFLEYWIDSAAYLQREGLVGIKLYEEHWPLVEP